MRDARISSIYEGTTGIQANDLVGRKIARESGATAKALIQMMRATDAELAKGGTSEHLAAIGVSLKRGIDAFAQCVGWIVASYGSDIKAVHAQSVPFLMLTGVVTGGWLMARAALIADKQIASNASDSDFYAAKLGTARFYADHILSRAPGLADSIIRGAMVSWPCPRGTVLARAPTAYKIVMGSVVTRPIAS